MAVAVAPPPRPTIPGLTPLPGGSGIPLTVKPLPAAKDTGVTGMQQFLNSHGYKIPVDGINGVLTQAAAADFRGSRNPTAFNVGHGLVTSVLQQAAGKAAAPAPPKTRAPAAAKPAAAPAMTGSSSTPASSDQATAQSVISAILKPILDEINKQAATQGQNAKTLISGYTTSAQDALKGIDYQQPFTNAAAQESAINTALMNQLKGVGGGAQDQLAGELASAGSDPTFAAALGSRLGNITTGAANAGLASGGAAASKLIGQGAAAKGYGDTLPGITALAGLQDLGKALGGIETGRQTQVGSLQSKVPGMVQSELTALSSARTAQQKNAVAAAIAEGYDPTTGQLTPKARASLASALGYDPMTGKPTAKTTIGQENADSHAQQVGINDASLKAKLAAADAKAKTAGKLHGLSQNEYQTKAATALGLARVAHTPYTDSSGTTHPPVSWQQFLNGGLKKNVPIWILIEQGRRVYSQAEIKQGLIPGAKK